MRSFLINTAILSVVYAMMGLFVKDQLHLGYVIIAVISAAICTPGPWLSVEQSRYAVPRDEALRWCDKKINQWPQYGLLPLPPEGWTWMTSNLDKRPVLVSAGGLITQGDWHDGF